MTTEEMIQVWVRPQGVKVFHRHEKLPTRLAFALVHQLRKREDIAWAYCDEPSVIPERSVSSQESSRE